MLLPLTLPPAASFLQHPMQKHEGDRVGRVRVSGEHDPNSNGKVIFIWELLIGEVSPLACEVPILCCKLQSSTQNTLQCTQRAPPAKEDFLPHPI